MKLAEALRERADLTNRINELRTRLTNNATMQEGEEPAEKVKDLLKELDTAIDRLEHLIRCINLTNSTVQTEKGSITALMAHRDAERIRLNAYKELINNCSDLVSRARYSEIRILPTVKARELQPIADSIAKDIRETDVLIQQTNWNTELIESD
ncbi:MAG: DIP1984 family protein [Oscillospiraceae bacterium]|nr:DIP1984 family protein [Oscillospiraceae bacterium]